MYNLVCETGIESRIAGIVGTKQAFFKGLFDGDSDTIDFGQASGFLANVQKLYAPSVIDAVAKTDDVADQDADFSDARLDDDITDSCDALIEAGDESHDGTVSAAPTDRAPEPAAYTEQATAALPASGDVRDLFTQLQVRREPNGRVIIEAPGEAAATLGALFEGMAMLLQSLARAKS